MPKAHLHDLLSLASLDAKSLSDGGRRYKHLQSLYLPDPGVLHAGTFILHHHHDHDRSILPVESTLVSTQSGTSFRTTQAHPTDRCVSTHFSPQPTGAWTLGATSCRAGTDSADSLFKPSTFREHPELCRLAEDSVWFLLEATTSKPLLQLKSIRRALAATQPRKRMARITWCCGSTHGEGG